MTGTRDELRHKPARIVTDAEPPGPRPSQGGHRAHAPGRIPDLHRGRNPGCVELRMGHPVRPACTPYLARSRRRSHFASPAGQPRRAWKDTEAHQVLGRIRSQVCRAGGPVPDGHGLRHDRRSYAVPGDHPDAQHAVTCCCVPLAEPRIPAERARYSALPARWTRCEDRGRAGVASLSVGLHRSALDLAAVVSGPPRHRAAQNAGSARAAASPHRLMSCSGPWQGPPSPRVSPDRDWDRSPSTPLTPPARPPTETRTPASPPGAAPGPPRIPNSCARDATTCETMPKIPIAERVKARTPKKPSAPIANRGPAISELMTSFIVLISEIGSRASISLMTARTAGVSSVGSPAVRTTSVMLRRVLPGARANCASVA